MDKAGRLVAVVDDNPSVLKALQRLLSAWSFRASTYESADVFLASIGDERPECLIIDYQMPGMNGLELRQRLKRERIEIPTIIITAQDENDLRLRCELAGAVALLTKPLQDEVLLSAIERALVGGVAEKGIG